MLDLIKKFIPQNFNDLLALILMIIVIPGLWIFTAFELGNRITDIVTGATIPVWTLIAQFYFRKAQSEQ